MADLGFINMVLEFYETNPKKLIVPAVQINPAYLLNDGNEDEEMKMPAADQDAQREEIKDIPNNENDNEIVENELIHLNDRTVKFLASFFTIIIEINFKNLSIIAKRFQMP